MISGIFIRIVSSVKSGGWLTSSAALESLESAAKPTFAFTGKAISGSSGRPVGKRVNIKMRSLSFGVIAFRHAGSDTKSAMAR
jgi:hypothetical protein